MNFRTRIVKVAAALTLSATVVGIGSLAPVGAATERRGDPAVTRKVNEYEGQHRFGGGTDTDCDPHAIDTLAGSGTGAADEAQAQHDMLKYECNPDGSAKTGAVLKMVRKS